MSTSKKPIALAVAVIAGSLSAGFAGAQTCTYYNGWGLAAASIVDLGSCNGGGECLGQSCNAGVYGYNWHQDCYEQTTVYSICS